MAPLTERKQACLKDPKTCSKIKLDELDLKSESAVLVQNFCLFQKRPEACLEAGNRFSNLSKMDKAKRFYKAGCDLKDQTSCKKLADMTPKNQTENKNPYDAYGLKIEEIEVGTGKEVGSGTKVSVHYKGKLENGTQFDSSEGRGPFEFKLGDGTVIKGWDLGIPGMRVGGKRRLFIPAALGYGHNAVGKSIPPNSNLIFEVEMMSMESGAEAKKAQQEGTASNPSDGPSDVAQAEPFDPLNAFVGFNPYETRSDICHHYCEAPDAFTLFKSEEKVIQLKPTKLKEIINDCNGEKVLVNQISGIANLKGSLFKSGKVVGKELSENLNGIASLSFNNITHTITRSPSGELILKNGQKQQTLLRIGSAMVDKVELVFQGDLDRDGKMDLVIEVRYSEGVATYLFLSSPAKEDQIVNPDAYLDVKNLDDC